MLFKITLKNPTVIWSTLARLLDPLGPIECRPQLVWHKERQGDSAIIQTIFYQQFELETFEYFILQNSIGSFKTLAARFGLQ